MTNFDFPKINTRDSSHTLLVHLLIVCVYNCLFFDMKNRRTSRGKRIFEINLTIILFASSFLFKKNIILLCGTRVRIVLDLRESNFAFQEMQISRVS